MNSKSFTLVELIMTLVVVGIVAWIGIAAMLSGVDTWGFFTQRKELLSDGRMSMDRMIREIRMVKNKTSVTTANATTFRFTDTADKDMMYSISSGTIRRTEDEITNGLLNNVTSLSFTYYDANDSVIATPVVLPSETNIRRVRIAIALSKGTSKTLNLRLDVWPRNLR